MVERAKKYKVVQSNSIDVFNVEVELSLNSGWLLFGHNTILISHGKFTYFQTLIKG